MNVLAVLPKYVPDSRVGSWITTHEYLVELGRRGHHVTVVTINSKLARYEIDGIDVHPNGADVVRPHVILSHLGDENGGARYARSLQVPSIRLVHGYLDRNRILLDKAPTALAIFSSQALADWTHWNGDTLVAHPPIHRQLYRVKPGNRITLVNLSALKGGQQLAEIAGRLPHHPFLAVRGWGQQIEEQPANVTIIDPVTDMRDVYRQTRLLLMPSYRESYGRVAVEAACSGIPTIAHPSPGLVEAMGDAATWVDRDDIDGWCQMIEMLVHDPGWRAASKVARRAIPTDTDETIAMVADAIEAVVAVHA